MFNVRCSNFCFGVRGPFEALSFGENDEIDAEGQTHHLDRVVVQKKMAPGYRAVLRRQSQEDKPSVEWPFFLSCVLWLSESGRKCGVALTLVRVRFSAPTRPLRSQILNSGERSSFKSSMVDGHSFFLERIIIHSFSKTSNNKS